MREINAVARILKSRQPPTLALGLLALVAAPNSALACHKGDPAIPHGAQTTCDGGGGVIPTTFVLEDANGNVVGPVLNLEQGGANVIVSTPDQRLFLLRIATSQLHNGDGFERQGIGVYFEGLGCPANETAFLGPSNAVPNVFHEVALLPDGAGGFVPWVGTSFENPPRGILSQLFGDGSCSDFGTPQNGSYYPADQLTDEFGDLVEDINVLSPPPLAVEVQ